MKLIDLLVQELPKRGGWPSGVASIEQRHNGELQAFQGFHQFGYLLELSDDWKGSVVCRGEYLSALSASQQPSWNGEGLPPVGTICEALAPVGKGELFSWQRVKVVESGIDGAEKECLVYNLETTMPSWVDEFRPIRTVAERNREDLKAAIAELCRQSASNGHSADLIYDAIAAGKIPGVKLEAADE